MQEESRKIASNTLVQIVGRVIVLALSLVSIKLITNYLGAANTGYYNTIVTYFSLFIVVADFGLFSVAVREISKNPENDKKILANIFSLRFVSAIVVTTVAVAVAFFTNYPPEIKMGVLAAALFPIFNLASSVYDMLFQSRLQMQKVVFADIIARSVALLGVILAVIFSWGFYAIVATVSLSALINFIIKSFYSRYELPIGFAYDKKLMLWITKLALPLGFVFIVNNLYFRIDTLMLFYFKGAVDVGIYAVAYRVLETTLFAGSYLASSLKPLLSKSVNSQDINDKKRAEKTIAQSITMLLFLALIITTTCTSLSKEIILFLSNAQFVGGSSALVVLGFATIFIYLSGILGEIMIAKDMRKTLIIISICILLFNIGLNVILIPKYSYLGAAWATLLSEIVLLTLGYLSSRKVLNIYFDYWRMLKLLVIGALSVLLSLGLKMYFSNLIVIFLYNLIIFVGGSYLFDAIPRQIVKSYLGYLKQKWLKRS